MRPPRIVGVLISTATIGLLMAGQVAWAYNFCHFGGRLGRPGVNTGSDFEASWDVPDNGTLTWYLDRNELSQAECNDACFAVLRARVPVELSKWASWIRVNFAEAATVWEAQIVFQFIDIQVHPGGADASIGEQTGTRLDWALVRIDPQGEKDWATVAGQDDFGYIVLHEAGHALGVGDLYSSNHGFGAVFEGEDFVDHDSFATEHLPARTGKADSVMQANGILSLDNDDIHAAQWLWGAKGSDAIVTGELLTRMPGLNANEAGPHHGLSQTVATWTYRGTVTQQTDPKVTVFFRGIQAARSVGPGTWLPEVFPDRVEWTASGAYEGNFQFEVDCDRPPERRGDAQVGATDFTQSPSNHGPRLFPFVQVFGADCDGTYVATTGSDTTGDGTLTAPYRSIEHGLDQTAPGGTLRVQPGTYSECLDYSDKPLRLFAEALGEWGDNTTTVIDGTGSCDAFGPTPGYVVTCGPDSLVQGFTITGGAGGVRGLGDCDIADNRIVGNLSLSGAGIAYETDPCQYGSGRGEIWGNLVQSNQVFFNSLAGFGGDGGGMFIHAGGRLPGAGCTGGDSEVFVAENILQGNSSSGIAGGTNYGAGAVVLLDAETGTSTLVTIRDNHFELNGFNAGASSTYGGGAWFGTSGAGDDTLEIEDNTFDQNSAKRGGGAAFWVRPQPTSVHQVDVRRNQFTDNQATEEGGGADLLYVARDLADPDSQRLALIENVLDGNAAQGGANGAGGGLFATLIAERSWDQGAMTIGRNIFRDNLARSIGGGLALFVSANSDPEFGAGPVEPAFARLEVVGNLVQSNQAVGSGSAVGGGLFSFTQAIGNASAWSLLKSNTIVNNFSEAGAGGAELESATFIDSQFSHGEAVVGSSSNVIASNSGLGLGGPVPGTAGTVTPGGSGNFSVVVSYSDLWDNGSAYATWIGDRTGIDGNLALDPQFVDPILGDFSLAATSPLIDAGDPFALFPVDNPTSDPPAFSDLGRDLQGNSRLFDGDGDGTSRVDIGAYEWIGCVDGDGDGYGIGLSVVACSSETADCDDTAASIFPGAAEILDGIDNQCPGDYGAGLIDEIGATAFFTSESELVWDSIPGASEYQVVRSTQPDLAGCTAFNVPTALFSDTDIPAPGQVFHYDIRVVLPSVGDWGPDSNGVPRLPDCGG